MKVILTPYLYSNYPRNAGVAPSFVVVQDKDHTWPNYSIHPYKDENGHRHVCNTAKKPRRQKAIEAKEEQLKRMR